MKYLAKFLKDLHDMEISTTQEQHINHLRLENTTVKLMIKFGEIVFVKPRHLA